MSSTTRLRAVILSLLLTVAGAAIPWTTYVVVGWRPPAADELRAAWQRQDLPPDIVIDIGVVVFLLMWVAACATALVEIVHVWRSLRDGRTATRRGRGPVRHLVHLALLTGATAASTLSLSSLQIEDAAASGDPDAPLITPDPLSSPDSRFELASFLGGLTTALLLSAGVVAAVDARRRRSWRASPLLHRTVTPNSRIVAIERASRAAASSDRLARLDMVLRAVAPVVAQAEVRVMVAEVDDQGAVVLHMSRDVSLSDPLFATSSAGTTWAVSCDVPIEDLAARAIGRAHPAPALVHVGRTPEQTDLFIDVESVGVLVIDSPGAPDIIRTMAATLALSPFLGAAPIVTFGLDDTWPGAHRCRAADSFAAALDLALAAAGSSPVAAAGSSTSALRATSPMGWEAWEPSLVVAVGETDVALDPHAASALEGGRGVALLTDRSVGTNSWTLSHQAGVHVLTPLGRAVQPVGLSREQLHVVQQLVGVDETFVPVDEIAGTEVTAGFEERDWHVLVRTFGGVSIVNRRGERATFERSKSIELLCWLAHHRERPTRSAARTALWDSDVRDATFANVVSEARRGLNYVALPPEGEDWLGRTLTDELPLHPWVVSDAELVEARLRHARGRPAAEAIAVLRPALELVDGMPFAGTGYLWNDGEGITSSLVVLATGVAAELASRYLEVGDIEGVFWATGRGLRVLSGHEELIALRMQAHADRGDLAGVRAEWSNYERALAADPWCSSEPAPKLLALRQTLLGQPSASGKPASHG